MFAEIQRKGGYLWSEPTAWDCAILPTLAFKPDHIWVFGKQGELFSAAGACKINAALVAHVIVLEVLEVGIEQHSNARSISDPAREAAIRSVFPCPVDVLYVVVAAYNHPSAHAEDKFFRKPSGSFEYTIVKSRKRAWQARIVQVVAALDKMQSEQSGSTVYIGH